MRAWRDARAFRDCSPPTPTCARVLADAELDELLRSRLVPAECRHHLSAGRAPGGRRGAEACRALSRTRGQLMRGHMKRTATKYEQREKLYEGKAKIVYATQDPDLVIQYFKDDATAFNAQKRGTIAGKGVVNNRMSAVLFELLEKARVPTHYLGMPSEREMLCRRLRHRQDRDSSCATSSRAAWPSDRARRGDGHPSTHRRALLQGGPARRSHDQRLSRPHAGTGHCRRAPTITPHRPPGQRRPAAVPPAQAPVLVDFKLEFGRHRGRLWLADEISPDTCRLWDAATRERLDKDRFRRDMGGVEEAYQEVYRRVRGGGLGKGRVGGPREGAGPGAAQAGHPRSARHRGAAGPCTPSASPRSSSQGGEGDRRGPGYRRSGPSAAAPRGDVRAPARQSRHRAVHDRARLRALPPAPCQRGDRGVE